MASPRAPQRFPFAFDRLFALPGRLFGITPSTAGVELDDDDLRVRFGPWRVETPRHNIATAALTGPYGVLPTIGPAHVSLRDWGLTFATNRRVGLCLTFVEPVGGIDPLGVVRHRGLTLTIADPVGLLAELRQSGTVRSDLDRLREEQARIDHLHTLPTSELRDLAADHGIPKASSASHDDLVDALGPLLDR